MGSVSSAVSSVTNGVSNFVGQAGGFLGRATGMSQFTPDGYNIDRGAFDPNQQEQDYVNQLIDRSQGKTPSVAELQMTRGLDAANSNANALAASQRGIAPGLAARLAAQSQSQNSNQVMAQTGQLRAQEQMANDQLLGQELQSQRQGRMSRESLSTSGNLGLEGLRGQGYEGSANRGFNTLKQIGQSATMMAMSHGGMVPGYADGGFVSPSQMAMADMNSYNSFAQALGQQVGQILSKPIAQTAQLDTSSPTGGFSKPGSANQLMAGGPMDAGGALEMAPMLAANGGKVYGQANTPGDSPENDTVPAMLSPGEIVIPRTVVKKGPQAVASFAAALMKKEA
jgi:hypothetical protein